MLIEDASARIVEELHSRVPVYDPVRGPEFIVGVVYSKDISRLMHFPGDGDDSLCLGALYRDAAAAGDARGAGGS